MRYKNIIFILIIAFFEFSCNDKPSRTVDKVETYRNPVIAGDFPDPTVIRVGNTYYAATSSSEWGLPYRLFQSKDLVNWEYIGPLFHDVPEWIMGSFWAPELYYYKDTFYVYYTARRKSDKRSYIGVATTKDIHAGFSDHGLLIEWTNEAIDAYVIDIDSKPYITWKAYGLDERPIEILGAELSEDRLHVTGETISLLAAEPESWEYGGIEGQCLVKHGDYLYLFYAGAGCCGKNCNYATGVARAKTIKGPWEKFSGNPILHGDGTWVCPGHGTLVTTPDKRFFYLYHAYNKQTHTHVGRQVMLDEIIWDEKTGWPQFRYGTSPSLQAEVPIKGTCQQAIPNFTDDFSSESMKKEWIWDISKACPTYTLDTNGLKIQGDDTPIGSFIGLQPKTGNYTFEITLLSQADVESGICLYGNTQEAVGISILKNQIELWKVENGKRSIIDKANVVQKETTLFVTTRNGNQYQFGWREQNKSMTLGENMNIERLPQWDRPANVGIQAKGKGKANLKYARLIWE